MKLIKIISVLALLIVCFSFENPDWKIKSSSVTFSIKNAGITVNGSFTGFESAIKFNTLKPEDATIIATVSSTSINTGIALRDKHLRKEDYFNVEKFPKITLQSKRIEKTGPISYNGYFNLTLKGVTREVIIPFNFIKIPEKTEMKGSFKINRKDYGVGGNNLSMSDEVTINLSVILTN